MRPSKLVLPLLALATLAAPIAMAETTAPAAAPAAQPPLDPAMKVPEVIAFMGLRKGMKVADVFAGKLTGPIAEAVGPTGKVYAIEPAEVVKISKKAAGALEAFGKAGPTVVASGASIAAPLPTGLDVVFIRQNYHDLYDKFMGPADVPAFNRNVFNALKKGGVFVILDHAAPAGSGIASTDTTHRIDPARVKADMAAAGFKFAGESRILANPADDHTKGVFDPSLRGHTDQFLMKFRKP